MTKEKAKDLLDNLIGFVEDNHGSDYDEALKIAIKALEEKPCEDCISRQAVLEGVNRYIKKVQSTGAKDDFISFEELVVKELPPITPQPKTGRWISHKEYCEKHDLIPSGLVTLEWCSNCDYGVDINKRGWDRYKYCPNCGAKMEE